MSIQTELTRITNAKAAIKAAIEGKGVTVPEATLLDGMAALIESIEAGGVNYNSKIVKGSFTLSERTEIPHQAFSTYDAFKIEHNSGFVPRAVFLYTEKIATDCPTLYVSVVTKASKNNDSNYLLTTSAVYKFGTTQRYANNHATMASFANWNDSFVTIGLRNTSMYFAAGLTINWAVI